MLATTPRHMLPLWRQGSNESNLLAALPLTPVFRPPLSGLECRPHPAASRLPHTELTDGEPGWEFFLPHHLVPRGSPCSPRCEQRDRPWEAVVDDTGSGQPACLTWNVPRPSLNALLLD